MRGSCVQNCRDASLMQLCEASSERYLHPSSLLASVKAAIYKEKNRNTVTVLHTQQAPRNRRTSEQPNDPTWQCITNNMRLCTKSERTQKSSETFLVSPTEHINGEWTWVSVAYTALLYSVNCTNPNKSKHTIHNIYIYIYIILVIYVYSSSQSIFIFKT